MKTEALVSCAISAQLICGFAYAYKKEVSHDVAHLLPCLRHKIDQLRHANY